MSPAGNPLPIVAIVGRPNVGKSTLFNRIVGGRPAIVEDRARTTRDRLDGDAEWNGRRFVVVDEEEEWDAAVPRKKRMALISQSTQPPWKFEKLAAFMVGRAHELKIVNTVCPVTIRRQQDTMEIAAEVDLMVVVGGRSSANTKELTRLCEIAGTHAIQIENVRELTDPSVFDGKRVVGVTGGTSTPIEDLRDVTERILEMAGTSDISTRAAELAQEALLVAATPAGRTTSLPTPSTAAAGAA